jgi:hypothetical protein
MRLSHSARSSAAESVPRHAVEHKGSRGQIVVHRAGKWIVRQFEPLIGPA